MNTEERRALLVEFCASLGLLDGARDTTEDVVIRMRPLATRRVTVNIAARGPASPPIVHDPDDGASTLTATPEFWRERIDEFLAKCERRSREECPLCSCGLGCFDHLSTVATSSKPERFWRVVNDGYARLWWAMEVFEDGIENATLSPPEGRHGEAAARSDGVASGYPEWKP